MKDVVPVVMSHGNVTEEESVARAKLVAGYITGKKPNQSVAKPAVIQLKESDRIGRDLAIEHNDSAVTYYMQASNDSIETQALFSLLSQVLSQPFYNDLRTAKQLGYFVFASELDVGEVPGIIFSIQSPAASPEKLLGAVQQFIAGYRDKLSNMTDAEFTSHRDAVISKTQEPERRLRERSWRYWLEINREEYGFDHRERLISALKSSSREDVLKLYDEVLVAESRGRVLVWTRGKKATEIDESVHSSLPVNYENLDQFKSERQKFP